MEPNPAIRDRAPIMDSILIAANDVVFGPGDIGRAVDFAVADEVAIRHLNSFNAFLVRPSAIEQVGWFDECFYPAYKEDQDYMYRVRLANMRRVDVPQMNVRHDESMTIRSNSAYYRANETTHYEWNLRYYRAKWGGDVGAEAFTRPFNRAECDVTYWPDSVETIGVRDWDRQSIRSSSMPTEAVSKTTDSEVPGPFHNISDLAKAIWSIRSAAFPKVFLRMDGRGVTRPDAAGAGKVNCQYGKAGPWERFRFEPQRDGTFAIRSAEFSKRISAFGRTGDSWSCRIGRRDRELPTWARRLGGVSLGASKRRNVLDRVSPRFPQSACGLRVTELLVRRPPALAS